MQIQLNDGGIVIATHANLMLTLYGAVPQASHFMTMRQVELGILQEHPGGMGIVNLLLRAGKMLNMGGEARKLATQLGIEMAPRTLCIANIVEGGGFFAATARSIIASVAMLSQHPFPQKIFADVPSGVQWFAGEFNARSPIALTEAELTAMLEEIRQARVEVAG